MTPEQGTENHDYCVDLETPKKEPKTTRRSLLNRLSKSAVAVGFLAAIGQGVSSASATHMCTDWVPLWGCICSGTTRLGYAFETRLCYVHGGGTVTQYRNHSLVCTSTPC